MLYISYTFLINFIKFSLIHFYFSTEEREEREGREEREDREEKEERE